MIAQIEQWAQGAFNFLGQYFLTMRPARHKVKVPDCTLRIMGSDSTVEKGLKSNVKEIASSDRIDLPCSIVYHNVDGKHLFIAPHKPSWIVTNDVGAFMLLPLSDGETVEQALGFAMSNLGLDQALARSEMEVLLQEIEDKKFYESTQPEEVRVKKVEGALHMALTHGCNLHCTHCYLDAGKLMDDELTTEEWKSVVDKFTEVYGESIITLSGGEPLLRQDFFEIAEHAKSRGLSLFLMTNGTLINTQEVATRLARLMDKIQISVEGTSPETTDAIRGKGTFNRILTAIQFLKETDVKLYLAFVILPENLNALEKELAGFVTSLQYPGINIRIDDALTNLGRASEFPIEYFELSTSARKSINSILQQLWDAGWAKRPSITLNRRLKNCAIGHGLSVDANGDIYPCSMPICKYGNFRTHNFRELAEQISRLYMDTNVDNMEKCKDCELKYVCTGGCRIQNFIRNGSFLIPTCDNETKQRILRKMVDLRGI